MRTAILILTCLLAIPSAVADTRVCADRVCAYDTTYTYADATCEDPGMRHATTGVGGGYFVGTPTFGVVVIAAVYAQDYCTNNGSTYVREHGIGATVAVPGATTMAWWGTSEGSYRFPDGCHMGARVYSIGFTAPLFVPCVAPPPDLGWGQLLP